MATLTSDLTPDAALVSDHQLFRRWHYDGESEAREELVRRHLNLARKLAGTYMRTQEPFDDLYQVASLGLLNAIDRFDPDLGHAFSSFAVPTILGELKRYFRDKGWAVHLPRAINDLVLRVHTATATLTDETGRSPTVGEIARYLSVDSEQVVAALDATQARRAISLDAPVEGACPQAGTRHDLIGSEDDGYGLLEASLSLAAAIRTLSPSDLQVFQLRYGERLRQCDIAERLGVSQMQVSRTLRRIGERLQARLDPPLGA